MNLAHVTDGAVPYPFVNQTRTFTRMPLIPHLGHNICLFCCLSELTGLFDRMSQRFLHKHMLAHLNSSHGDDRMGVIRSRDCDGIDILFLIQHDAEILVFFGLVVHLDVLRIIPVGFQEVRYMHSIHITHGNNILRTDPPCIP